MSSLYPEDSSPGILNSFYIIFLTPIVINYYRDKMYRNFLRRDDEQVMISPHLI